MKLASFLMYAVLLSSTLASAQQALNNEAIAKMAHAGLSDDIIVSMVESQPGAYTVTPEALIALKSAGVSQRVLGAMVAKANGSAVEANTGAPTPLQETSSDAYDSLDTGVYQKVNGEWVSLPSERVNWKTGGFLKSIATDGIVKEDVNGRLSGASSQATLHTPVELVIRTADGVEATDFELVHLHDKSNAREFRTVTGGVFHASGGASRDAVSFEQKSIARHTYLLTFTMPLPPGEYAFLVPGFAASTTSGSTGKAYTFRLTE